MSHWLYDFVGRASTPKQRERVGMLLMSVGVLLFTVMDALVKLLVESTYSVLQILAIRGGIITLSLFLFSLKRSRLKSLATRRLHHHALRAVVGFFAPALFFFVLGKLPLADTTVLFFAAPFLMTALAVPLLKENVPRQRWILIGAGFLGVLIASQPGSTTFQMVALLALGSAVAYALMSVMGRWMSSTESVLALVFYFNLSHTLIAGSLLPYVWKPMPPADFGVLALVTLLAALGQFLLTAAFRLGPMGLIAPFEYSALIWTVVVGFLVFGDIPTHEVVLGAVIIGVSGIYLARRETRGAPSAV